MLGRLEGRERVQIILFSSRGLGQKSSLRERDRVCMQKLSRIPAVKTSHGKPRANLCELVRGETQVRKSLEVRGRNVKNPINRGPSKRTSRSR